MFDGIHCPKCGKLLKQRSARIFICRCGWSIMLPESNFEKMFFSRPIYF